MNTITFGLPSGTTDTPVADTFNVTAAVQMQSVPEPSSLVMMFTGIAIPMAVLGMVVAIRPHLRAEGSPLGFVRPAALWPGRLRDDCTEWGGNNLPRFPSPASALWLGLPTLPPGRPEVTEPNLRPETDRTPARPLNLANSRPRADAVISARKSRPELCNWVTACRRRVLRQDPMMHRIRTNHGKLREDPQATMGVGGVNEEVARKSKTNGDVDRERPPYHIIPGTFKRVWAAPSAVRSGLTPT